MIIFFKTWSVDDILEKSYFDKIDHDIDVFSPSPNWHDIHLGYHTGAVSSLIIIQIEILL